MNAERGAAVPEAVDPFLEMRTGEVDPDRHIDIRINVLLRCGEGKSLLLPRVHNRAPRHAHPREHDEAEPDRHAVLQAYDNSKRLNTAVAYSDNTTGSTLLISANPISIAIGISTPIPTNTGTYECVRSSVAPTDHVLITDPTVE